MLICFTRFSTNRKIFISIYEVGVAPTVSLSGYRLFLVTGREEVPDEEWLCKLGDLFAQLDPLWNQKRIVFQIRIPILARR